MLLRLLVSALLVTLCVAVPLDATHPSLQQQQPPQSVFLQASSEVTHHAEADATEQLDVSTSVYEDANGDLQMCRAVLNAIFPGLNMGKSLTSLSDEQALGCWCLWSKTKRASQLTAAVFEFYKPFPGDTIKAVAKTFLKAAWAAYKKSTGSGTNLISRAFMAAYSRSAAEACFNQGEELMGTGCGMLTDRCKLYDCYTSKKDKSKWYMTPAGECERPFYKPLCNDKDCKPKKKNACPVDGKNTKCTCRSGIPSHCTCVSQLRAGMESYCDGKFGDIS